MKKTLLALTTLMAISATPAFACKCAYDPARAQAIINDQNYAVAEVFVRGMNVRNHQSMLHVVREPIVGGLLVQDFRAHWSGSSCGSTPQYKQNQKVLIHFEADGTYAIQDQCDTESVLQYLQENPNAAAGTTPAPAGE